MNDHSERITLEAPTYIVPPWLYKVYKDREKYEAAMKRLSHICHHRYLRRKQSDDPT